MASKDQTLGAFIAELMRRQNHNNVSLAGVAGVSEGVIRNLLKHGVDPKAKDPDAATLRRVADALDVNALYLFRLAGYLPPAPDAPSVRAEYLARVFDDLPPEKQDAVMGVLEAMADKAAQRSAVRQMRTEADKLLAGIDEAVPGYLRTLANHLIAEYDITDGQQVDALKPDVTVLQYRWGSIPAGVRERIKALVRHKLSLDYDPTMVDPEWRD